MNKDFENIKCQHRYSWTDKFRSIFSSWVLVWLLLDVEGTFNLHYEGSWTLFCTSVLFGLELEAEALHSQSSWEGTRLLSLSWEGTNPSRIGPYSLTSKPMLPAAGPRLRDITQLPSIKPTAEWTPERQNSFGHGCDLWLTTRNTYI